jgi:hypothetical protein
MFIWARSGNSRIAFNLKSSAWVRGRGLYSEFRDITTQINCYHLIDLLQALHQKILGPAAVPLRLSTSVLSWNCRRFRRRGEFSVVCDRSPYQPRALQLQAWPMCCGICFPYMQLALKVASSLFSSTIVHHPKVQLATCFPAALCLSHQIPMAGRLGVPYPLAAAGISADCDILRS